MINIGHGIEKKNPLGWILGVFSVGICSASCTLGTCRKSGEMIHEKNLNQVAQMESDINKERQNRDEKFSENRKDHVFVYQPDGSLQCKPKTGTTLEVMAKDLKEIKIYSQENKSDGLNHIQVCGTPTGQVNVYEIDRKNLEKAKKQYHFKEWNF